MEPSCTTCSTTEKVSKKIGLCKKCYMKEYFKTYRQTEKNKQYKHEWYLAQKEEQLARDRARYNETRERRVAAAKKWKKDHPKEVNACTAKRRADKLKRTPSWADLEKIKEFYKNCPEGMTVDHIIPLNGKTVSGLHVEYNLQYLSPSENYRKSNSFSSESELSNAYAKK